VDDSGTIWLFRIAGLFAGIALSLPVARRIGGYYRAKRTSEQELFIDTWWALYTLIQTVILVVTRESPALLITLAAFPAYWSVKRWLMGGLRAAEAPPVRLLLLRVFGHDRRTERLLDELTLRWRPIGTVELIAGRDLAFRNIDPQELYTFLTGGLAREFVKDDGDLARRLDHSDERQDPDGRYRLTQFFCHRNTWQRVLDNLVARCDAVLMDLRGFDEKRLGCQYEITRLGAHLGEKTIVLLTDQSTRVDLLETLLSEAALSRAGGVSQGTARGFLLEAGGSPAETVATATRLLLGARPA